MLTTIVWSNRGSASFDSDGFGSLFGTDAALARSIVDRAIDDWEAVIDDFNFDGRANSYDLVVQTGELDAVAIGGPSSVDGDGKPFAGGVTIDTDTTHYLDPTVDDDSEFTNFVWRFAAFGSVTGVDLYTTLVHEIGHAVGVLTGGSLAINDFVSNSGVDDPNSDDSGNLLLMNVPGGTQATFTASDPGHLWEGPPTPETGALPAHPNDLMNPGRALPGNQRFLITDLDAGILRDAYGYSVTMPSQVNTFYADLNTTTGQLIVRGDVGGSDDNIIVRRNGTFLEVLVNGTFETFTIADISSLIVNGLDGEDTIQIESLPAGFSTTVNGGNGDDAVHVGGGDYDNNIVQAITVNGGMGTDWVIFEDSDDLNGADNYVINATTISKTGSPTATFLSTEELVLHANPQSNFVNVESTAASTNYVINGDAGNDTLQLSSVAHDLSALDGGLVFHGQAGTDRTLINDFATTAGFTYTIDADAFGPTTFTRNLVGDHTIHSTERFELRSGSGSSTFNFEGTESTTEWDLFAGAGNDVLRLSPTAGLLGRLNGTIDFVGEGGTDTIELFNTASTQAGLNVFDLGIVNPGEGADIEYDLIEGITFRDGAGNGTYQIIATATSVPLAIHSGAGNDTFVLSHAAMNLDNIDGNITLAGEADLDSVILHDESNGFADTYTLTSTTFDRSAFPLVSHSGMEVVTLHGGSSDNTFNIQSNAAATQTTINTRGGEDRVVIGGTTGDVTNVQGDVFVNGQFDTDSLVYYDVFSGLDSTYTLTSNTLTRSGSGIVHYSTIDEVIFNAGFGDDAIDVQSSVAGVPLTINAGSGDDTITLGANLGHINTLNGAITVNGQGNSDTLVVDDTSNALSDDFTITDTIFTRSFSAIVTYATIEGLEVFAGTSNNAVNIESTAAGTPVTVHGGDGDDTFTLSPTAGNMATLQGAVSLLGGADDDILIADDTSNLNSDSFTITPNTLARSSSATVAYDTFEDLTLNAGPGDNEILVMGTAVGAPLLINAANGNDLLNVIGAISSPITYFAGFDAGPPGNRLRVEGDGTIDGAYTPATGTPGVGTVEIGGHAVNYFGLSTLFGGGPLEVKGFDTFTVVTPGSEDNILVDSPASNVNRLTGTSGGHLFDPLTFFSITNVVIDTGASDASDPDDVVTIESPGLVSAGLADFRVAMGPGQNTLNINGGLYTLREDAALDSDNLAINVTGSGTELVIDATQHLRSLSIGAGALARMTAGGDKVLVTPLLDVAGGATPSGTFDLHDNGLVINYDDLDPSPLTTHQAQMDHARDQNAPVLWTGTGITSSLAIASPSTTFVILSEATTDFGSGSGSFFGEAIVAGDEAVLIRAESTAPPALIFGRQVFYNDSFFDGDDPAANSADDGAIDPDKTALLPGQTASFANYVNYTQGINGLIVDVYQPAKTPELADFQFHDMGRDGTSESVAPPPDIFTVRPGEGVNGSDRVTLIWDTSGGIVFDTTWLRVTVGMPLGLSAPDVFYFGSAPGEGSGGEFAQIDPADELGARNNTHGFGNPATVNDPWDYNKDRFVDPADQLFARNHGTGFLTRLVLFTAPAIAPLAIGNNGPDTSAALPPMAAGHTDDQPELPADAQLCRASDGLHAAVTDARIWSEQDDAPADLLGDTPRSVMDAVFEELDGWLAWDVL
ncbi:MAG: hypothetical protein WDZ59_12340 [Pirellulales bacterium]